MSATSSPPYSPLSSIVEMDVIPSPLDEEEKHDETMTDSEDDNGGSDVNDDEPVVVKEYVSAEMILWKTWSDGNITVAFLSTPADRQERHVGHVRRRTREWLHGDGRMFVKRVRAVNNSYD